MSDGVAGGVGIVGETIAGRYRIISRLKAGGMGDAFRAWDENTAIPVVVKMPKKVFLEDPTFVERFHREAMLLQNFSHAHIVPIIEVGTHGGVPFVVMRFLPGGSLSNRRPRDENGKPQAGSPEMLRLWLPTIAEAIDFVHAHGVVHRDVKPANILFDAFSRAYLGDFGIAKVVEESATFDKEQTLTATHMGLGTQPYMAPEQFSAKPLLTGAVDRYALAVTVYEMLAGRRPFEGDSAHLIIEITSQEPPDLRRLRPDVPAHLCGVVHRAMAKRPQDRYATCMDFANAVLAHVPPWEDEPGIARLACPQCSFIIKIETKDAGRQGACPKCAKRLVIAADLSALWMRAEQRIISDTGGGRPSSGPADADKPVAEWPSPEPLDFTPLSKPTLVLQRQRGKQRKATYATLATLALLAGSVAIGIYLWPKQQKLVPDRTKLLSVDDGRLVVFPPKGFTAAPRRGGTNLLVEYTPSAQESLPRIRVSAGGDPPDSAKRVSLDRGKKQSKRTCALWYTSAEPVQGMLADLKSVKCVVDVGGRFYTVEATDLNTKVSWAELLCLSEASWLEPGKEKSVIPLLGNDVGFRVEYFQGRDLKKRIPYPKDIFALPLDFQWGNEAPFNGLPRDNFSIRWRGYFMPEVNGYHVFSGVSDDGVRITMTTEDRKKTSIVDAWSDGRKEFKSDPKYLLKGKKYLLQIEFYEAVGNAEFTLRWRGPSGEAKVLRPTMSPPKPLP